MKVLCFLLLLLLTGLLTSRAAVLDTRRDPEDGTGNDCPHNEIACTLKCERDGFAYGRCTGLVLDQKCECIA
uniref:Defensin B n=1 Tax=Ornithodoros turicata TaxID=34597 RepID=A0A6G6XE65_9ACAR|nr:defensin B [Ornithodoros turicata]